MPKESTKKSSKKMPETSLDKQRKSLKLISIAAAVFTGTGLFLILIFPSALVFILGKIMVLRDGSFIFEMWKAPPEGIITTSVRIFHVENPNEFIGGEKLRISERGPYAYNFVKYREIISWDGPNQETVKYNEFWGFGFNLEKSADDIKAPITVLNSPVFFTFAIVRSILDMIPLSFAIAPVAFTVTNMFFSIFDEKLFKTLTPEKLLHGYDFPIMELVDSALIKPLEYIGVPLPPERLPGNKFSLLAAKNHTNKNGPFEVWTGQGNIGPEKFLRFVSYRGRRTVNGWNDPRCDLINGTEGALHGPYTDTSKPIYYYVAELCRSFALFYDGFTLINGLVPASHFVKGQLYASPNQNPTNKCFCKLKENEKCQGIYDLGICYFGLPVYISKPHLLDASNYYKNQINGFSPDVKKHEEYMDIEPVIGLPLNVHVRVQANFPMKAISYAKDMSNIPNTLYPLMTLEIAAGLDMMPFWVSILAMFGLWPLKIITTGAPIFLLIGLALGGRAYQMYRQISKLEKEKPNEKPKSQTQNLPSNPKEVADPSDVVVVKADQLKSMRYQNNSVLLDQRFLNSLASNDSSTNEKQKANGNTNNRVEASKVSEDKQIKIDETASNHSASDEKPEKSVAPIE